ncbi:MAG: hypothetical protein AAF484_04920 [Pseudomonadota bacterium]
MSDRVSKAEIEDVLSSIRRLVSTDHRRDAAEAVTADPGAVRDDAVMFGHRAPKIDVTAPKADVPDHEDPPHSSADMEASADAPERDDAPEVDDRLVLTPTYKIEKPVIDDAARDMSVSAEPDMTDRTSVSDVSEPSLGLARWQVGAQDADEEAPQADGAALRPDTPVEEDSLGSLRPDVPGSALEAALSTLERGPRADPGPGDDSAPEHEARELEARIAEVEAAVAARDDQWEPDGSEPDAFEFASSSRVPLPWRETATKQDETLPDAAADDVVKDDDAESDAGSDHGPVPAQQDEDTRPEPGRMAVFEPRAPMAQGHAPASTPSGQEPWLGEDAVIDEEALRDLVSEIVRQELQGNLGERITRNVRKLVRREIHRAMMGQDLD